MPHLSVANWDEYQHYKKRNPPWIKLYNTLLDDFELMALPEETRWLAVGLLLLASRTDNKIPADPDFLRNRLWTTCVCGVEKLVSIGFISLSQDARAALAGCHSQERRGETETEQRTGAKAPEAGPPRTEGISGEGGSAPPPPEEPERSNPMGAFVEAIEEFAWLGETPPGKNWNIARDLSIVKRLQKKGRPRTEILDAIEGARIQAQRGELSHVEPTDPFTLRVIEPSQKNGAMSAYQLAVHACRKWGGRDPPNGKRQNSGLEKMTA